MQFKSNRSLPAILFKIVNMVWWLEWAGGLAWVVMVFTVARIRRGFALQIPISFSNITIRQFYPAANNGEVGILNTSEGTLSVHIAATFQNILMILMGSALIFAAVVLITYQFKKILQNIKNEQPFHQSNIRRAGNIAFILIGYSLVQWLFVLLINYKLNAAYTFHHINLAYNFNLSCLLAGIVLLVMKGVFKTGLLLEQDNQLTI